MNHTLKIVLTFLIFISSNIYSQDIIWQNTLGGTEDEWPFSIELTKDSNYLIGGYSFSNISGDKTENSRGFSDVWITKIDNISGKILWQKTIGGNSYDTAISVKETKDGGFIIGGYSSSGVSGEKTENSRGGDDFWVIKLDSNRNIIWDKTYGGNGTDRLTSIIETNDGGYLIGGVSNSNISGDKTENSRGLNDIWLIKINSNGNIEWQKTIGGNDIDSLGSIINTNDKGYILAGSSMSNVSGEKTENSRGFGGDFWILKIDEDGTILWDKTIGGNNGDYAKTIRKTFDGNYIIGGDSSSIISSEKTENSICNSTDIWLVKIDKKGNVLWDKTLGGDNTDWIGDIRETKDEGIIVGGMSASSISAYKTEEGVGDRDYWVVKLNKDGNVIWDKTLGGKKMDNLTTLIQSNDGNYVLGGWSTSNISGDKTENSNGSFDYWFIKLSSDYQSYNPKIFEKKTICEGSDITLEAPTGRNYKWSGPNGFQSSIQNPTISNISNTQSGTYNVTVSDRSLCTEVKIITIKTNSIPEINTINDINSCSPTNDNFAYFDLSKIKDIITTKKDNVITFFNQKKDTINNNLIGAYKNTIANEEIITVRVSNNDLSCYNETTLKLIVDNCNNDEESENPSSKINFPIFFTPNNDKFNDFWPNNKNNNLNIKSITIYDRYGKMLKKLYANDVGWDGYFNGKRMPQNDYWFTAIMLDNKIIKGHFSLIK